jgi:hypothetical protein
MISLSMRSYLKRALFVIVLAGAVAWTADWLTLRHRIAQDAAAYGWVEVHFRISVHMKNKRVETNPDLPQMVECVNSLFPHYDDLPCWYLERHKNQDQDLDGRPWHFYYDE